MKRFSFLKLALPLLALPLCVACVDNSVDYSDANLSKKYKVDVNGLKLNFGSTERIPLSKLIKADGNIQTDSTHLYYLVEEGQTEAHINVAPQKTQFNANTLHISTNFGVSVWEAFKEGVAASRGITLTDAMLNTGVSITPFINAAYTPFSDSKALDILPIESADIASLSAVDFEDVSFSLELQLANSQANNNIAQDLAIYETKDVVITLPDYIVSPDLNSRHQYLVPSQSFSLGVQNIKISNVRVDGLKFARALQRGEAPTGVFSIAGKVKVGVKRGFMLKGMPDARIDLVVRANGQTQAELVAKAVTGVFTPTIATQEQTFAVKQSLPEGFDGENTRLKVARPTLLVTADMKDVPVSAQLKNVKIITTNKGKQDSILLATTPVRFVRERENPVYFYEGTAPYSPTAVPATAQRSPISGLTKLITTLPDQVQVRFDAGSVTLTPEESTITFGKDYAAALRYSLYVPFLFDGGFHIGYSEVSDSIDLSREDFTTENATIDITADVISTIPLHLVATIIPYDRNDQPLPNVEVTPVRITAAAQGQPTTTPFALRIVAKDKDFVKKLHHVKFAFTADAHEQASGAPLRSDQYLQVTNAHLTVSGSVSGDFGKKND